MYWPSMTTSFVVSERASARDCQPFAKTSSRPVGCAGTGPGGAGSGPGEGGHGGTGAGQGTGVVEGQLDGEPPRVGDGAVRRLVAGDAAPGGRDPDGAALVTADRHVDLACRH